MDWSPLATQFGDFRQAPPQAHIPPRNHYHQDRNEALGQSRKAEILQIQNLQSQRRPSLVFQSDNQHLIRNSGGGSGGGPAPNPAPGVVTTPTPTIPTPTLTTPQSSISTSASSTTSSASSSSSSVLAPFTSANDSIMQTTTATHAGLLPTTRMIGSSAPHLAPSPTSHLLPTALPHINSNHSPGHQMGHVPFYQESNLPPIRSQQPYQNGYAVPPASPYMLMVTQPPNMMVPHPPTTMPPNMENDPVHVVGQQGRRGILPSAPGCSSQVTGRTLVPRKDENGKFVCPACIKSYQHLKHLKRHLLRHTGERPYMCPLCKDSFSRSDILKRHYQKCSHRRGADPGGDHLEGTRNKKHRTAVTLATSGEPSIGSTAFGGSGGGSSQEPENNIGGGPVGGYFPWTTTF